MTSPPDPAVLSAELSASAVSVFLFHGVTPEVDYGVRNYTGKHLVQESFVQIIRHLVENGHPVSMDDLLAHVTGNEPCPQRSFAITFDDGFWNNLSVAAPILSDFEIPATFYVTTDFIDLGRMSWVDRIEAAVATTHLTEVTCPYPIEGRYCIATTEDRIRFMSLVRRELKADSDTDVDGFADVVVDSLLCGRPLETVETLDRKLSWSEVRQLGAHSLFTIGGHGRTHRILGYLDPVQMSAEVSVCLSQLRSLGNSPAVHFSYPEGFVGSFHDDLVSELKQHRVRTAVSTIPGGNSRGTDPMRLRRFLVA